MNIIYSYVYFFSQRLTLQPCMTDGGITYWPLTIKLVAENIGNLSVIKEKSYTRGQHMACSGAQYGTGSLNLIGEQLLRFVCCFGPLSSVTVRSACSKDDKSLPSIFFSLRKGRV